MDGGTERDVLQEMLPHAVREVYWACRQQLMIPKVIETSDRQADNETKRERVWEEGSVGTLVKQDKDAAVLAWLFTPEKINMAAALVFLDALFAQCFGRNTLHAMNDRSLSVEVAIASQWLENIGTRW